MRNLKYHEHKLLKKSDFVVWKRETGRQGKTLKREAEVVRRYMIQDPHDYHRYNKIVGKITQLVSLLKKLPEDDTLRIRYTDDLLNKLFDMGLFANKGGLESIDKVNVSAFCRRRLPVMMVRMKFAERVKEAVELIEQGHIRVGPSVVKDPALIVTRAMEDFVSWDDKSKIRRKVLEYNNKVDDYDLL